MPEMSGDKVRPLTDVTLSRNKPDTCTVLLVLKIEQLITNEVQDFLLQYSLSWINSYTSSKYSVNLPCAMTTR